MLIQPVLRPVLQPVLRSIFDPGIGGGGTPSLTAQVQALFAKYSAKGGMYDAATPSGVAQDTSGTTPITTAGQTVARAADLSGNASNATQAASASRPPWIGVPRDLGAELLTNGRFDADSDWAKGTGWTISGGSASKAAGTAAVLSQSVEFEAGGVYQISYNITSTAGTLAVLLTGGTTVAAPARSSSSSWIDVLIAAGGNTTLEISADAAFAGSVRDISVRRVTTMTNMGLRFNMSPWQLDTTNIDFSGSDKLTVICAGQYSQEQAAGTHIAVGNWASTPGSVWAGFGSSSAPVGRLRGATGQNSEELSNAYVANATGARAFVDVFEFDLAAATQADEITITTAGTQVTGTSTGAAAGGGSFGASIPITLGNESFRGIMSRALVIGAKLTPEEFGIALRWAAEGMCFGATLGDSTIAYQTPVTGRTDAYVGGLVTGQFALARSGERIAHMKSAWQAKSDYSALQAVFVQCGQNDVKGRVGANTASTADVIADLQDLIDTIRADVREGCKIYACAMTPSRGWLEAATNPSAAYAAWLAVNEAIAGGGSTPITNVDARITSHVAAMGDANNYLLPIYDYAGDGIHPSAEGRWVNAIAWRAQLESDGLV